MSDARDDSSGRVGLVGKTLGRYRITAELGRGGMATVYRAFDPQLDRDVAVKVMHGTFTGRGDIEKRFRREAQAVAAIKHESIVDIFDFAPGGDGEPGYIVTEIIQGPTLRELMNQCGGRVLPEIAGVLAVGVAGALGAAHSHGIIHRDVKPDNVMIDCRPGAPVRVLLTDFGVARILEDDTMTATGSILGSPAYMSPEQARAQDVDKTSDVFSFGGLLYHLVTGRPPFPGKDPLAVIAAILTGEIPRPGQIEPHVSAALEAVIMRCLKRAPADRFTDGIALTAALRVAVQNDLPPGDEDPLRAFFDDRDAFLARLKPRVAEHALASARACVQRRELTRALAEVNRVFAYVPGHAGAESLLAGITSRNRWGRLGRVAAAVVVLGAGGAAAARFALSRSPAPVAVAMVAPEPPPKVVAAPVAPPERVEAPAQAAVVPTAEGPRPVVKRTSAARKPEKGARVSKATASDSAATGAISAEPSRTAAPGAAPSVAPSTTPPAAPTEPPPSVPLMGHVPGATTAGGLATASLMIRASQGFCSPSMDQQPAKIRPIYEGIAPGPHQIFCTLPGGDKQLVGTYEVRAGTRPSLVVIPGPDGRPMLGRPE